jgi:hypothetical protein
MCSLGPTPTERELCMWPTKLQQERAQLEQALTAPRLPADIVKRTQAALKALDRAKLLEAETAREHTAALQAQKDTPADTLRELCELLESGSVKTFPLDLVEAHRAAADSVEYLRQAHELAARAVTVLDARAYDSITDRQLLLWVAVERVRVGAGGTVSQEVRYLAARTYRTVYLPLEACRNTYPTGPSSTLYTLGLEPVRAERPLLNPRDSDRLGPDWLHNWQQAHLEEMRSFWSWCALLAGQVDRSSSPPRITADWTTRAQLCAVVEQEHSPAPKPPRQPSSEEIGDSGSGNGGVAAVSHSSKVLAL